MQVNPPLYGLVLNGGQSRRMGQAKGQLPLQHGTLLEWMQSLLHGAGAERIIVSGEELVDNYSNQGPLAGIEAALVQHPNVQWLIVPVDMPLLSVNSLQQLVLEGQQQQRSCYYQQRWLPLYLPVAARHQRLASQQLQSSCSRDWSLKAWLKQLSPLELAAESVAAELANTNTPEQWQTAVQQLTRSQPEN